MERITSERNIYVVKRYMTGKFLILKNITIL